MRVENKKRKLRTIYEKLRELGITSRLCRRISFLRFAKLGVHLIISSQERFRVSIDYLLEVLNNHIMLLGLRSKTLLAPPIDILDNIPLPLEKLPLSSEAPSIPFLSPKHSLNIVLAIAWNLWVAPCSLFPERRISPISQKTYSHTLMNLAEEVSKYIRRGKPPKDETLKSLLEEVIPRDLEKFLSSLSSWLDNLSEEEKQILYLLSKLRKRLKRHPIRVCAICKRKTIREELILFQGKRNKYLCTSCLPKVMKAKTSLRRKLSKVIGIPFEEIQKTIQDGGYLMITPFREWIKFRLPLLKKCKK